MSKSTAAQGLFGAPSTRLEGKAKMTDTIARSISEAEITAREAKTAKLRAARLAMEAAAPPPEPKPAKKAKAAPKTVAKAAPKSVAKAPAKKAAKKA